MVEPPTMDVTDPRQRYDDLPVEREEVRPDAEEYASASESEVVSAGWVAGAVVVDDADRLLLAYYGEDDVWTLPGGTVKPDESRRRRPSAKSARRPAST